MPHEKVENPSAVRALLALQALGLTIAREIGRMNERRRARPTSIARLSSLPGSRGLRQQEAIRRPISSTITIGLLRFGDAMCIVAGGRLSVLWLDDRRPVALLVSTLFIAAATLAMTQIAPRLGAYRREILWSWIEPMGRALSAWLLVMLATAVLAYAGPWLSSPLQEWLGTWALISSLLLIVSRCASGVVFSSWRRAGRLRRRAVILGAGSIGQRLIQQLASAPNAEIDLVGVYDDRTSRLPPACFGYAVRGNLDDLIADARLRPIDHVFIALPLSADWRLAEILNKLCLIPVDVRLCLGSLGFRLGECDVTHIGGLTTLNVCDRPVKGWKYVGKLVEDKVLATLILALAAPVMAVVAVLIKLGSPGPILFRQRRHGLNNELIEVLKFRTLYHEARDVNADRLCGKNDPRITPIGAFLRKSMLDELPQFLNVLRGDMSIVGPRPHALAAKAGGLLYREAVKYYDARHRMKPGITGWAQIHGWRGETRTIEEIDQRVAHDIYYIHHWTIGLDLRIIARTALDAFLGVVGKSPGERRRHAMPLAHTGRSRSAA